MAGLLNSARPKLVAPFGYDTPARADLALAIAERDAFEATLAENEAAVALRAQHRQLQCRQPADLVERPLQLLRSQREPHLRGIEQQHRAHGPEPLSRPGLHLGRTPANDHRGSPAGRQRRLGGKLRL